MGVKKEWLLEAFIKTYLDSHAPVGSESLRLALKERQDAQISSATIRNYFKMLTNDGAMRQSHTSSGRIPTNGALKSYWRAKLDLSTPLEVDLQKLQEASQRYEIFSVVERYKQAVLQDVYNHNDRFLILDFESTQMLLHYNKKLEIFIKDLIGLECKAIQNIALSVCATSLAKQIEACYQEQLYFGLCVLAKLLQAINSKKLEGLFLEIVGGNLFRHLEQGLHFEKILPLGFLGVLRPIKTQDEEMKMFCVGGLEQDFEGFYHSIRKVS
ncbi:HrcA family transcriptional regulator [Helicobacter felis]|uniref:HrcA family transcriptional regulator n=1 Tax=Helicobacter felis TaxID=214 RepID=UPI000CEF53F3|nr:HrcA family transcriptional regulator [Helicobacter felis]